MGTPLEAGMPAKGPGYKYVLFPLSWSPELYPKLPASLMWLFGPLAWYDSVPKQRLVEMSTPRSDQVAQPLRVYALPEAEESYPQMATSFYGYCLIHLG